MATFTLSVVAPDRSVVDEPVSSVMAPGQEGYFGVYAGHEPFAVALKPGMVEYLNAGGQRHFLSVSGGFAEIVGDRMTILADSAEKVSEIDVSRAERALDEARRALTGGDSDKPNEEAAAEMERALNRLRAAKKS